MPWLPWVCSVALAAWCYLILVVAARVDLLQRFDDGIEYSTVTYLLHGQLPYTDFYEPYGIGLGIPGALPRLFGIDGAFALRLVYGVFPALVTLFATRLVWRRCGALLGVLVGLVSMASTTPRYSIGFAALFSFALLVDRAVKRSPAQTLQGAAERSSGTLVLAGAVCSLAGWARTEYAVFAVLWAAVLVLALPRGRRRRVLSLTTVAFAALPTLIVLITGGLRHLWWFVSYTLSPSESGFRAQRGHPVEWHLLGTRLDELLHLHWGASSAGQIVGSYGVGAAVVIAGIVMLLVPAWRARLLVADRSYLTPFMVAACAIVLYGQAARFSPPYGAIGTPVFWVAGALLIGRVAPRPGYARLALLALPALLAVLAFPLLSGALPWSLYDTWAARPTVRDRVVVPGFDRIPMADDGGAASMAALVAQWHALGLDGRPTLSVALRNDVATGNDAIVGFLLDAPAAAWPLTYDPGLFNSDKVERATVAELCGDRAPVVQGTDAYAYPPGSKVYVGSRLLDEFLAIDYEVRAVAGFYRVLLPSTRRCVLPRAASEQQLQTLAARRIAQGELAAAGALAVERIERSHERDQPARGSDLALAALGGYALASTEVPDGALGEALRSLSAGAATPPPLAAAAARPWPTDVERLAAQTAWVEHHTAGEADLGAAAMAVYRLALRHADWPQAVTNLSAIRPPDPSLFSVLADRGAADSPGFDRWRRGYYLQAGDPNSSISAGIALVRDYERDADPVSTGQSELELATYAGVTPGCALALRRDAGKRPGVRVAVPSGGPPCAQPELIELLGQRP
ncbi:MAG TPA: hypothetical protein VHW67_01375 [Solirubrobacteraceae bacterium]|jgi:hypothetical protein|nr:hypothetical protein [Solirubrobacteraceae bacterium]